MDRYHYIVSPKSALIGVLVVIPFGIYLWFTEVRTDDRNLVDETYTVGEVLDINGTSETQFAIAKVELEDGGQARIAVRRPYPKPGDRMELRVVNYDDGSRDVHADYGY